MTKMTLDYQYKMHKHFMEVRGYNHEEAKTALEIFMMGYETGEKHGQAAAQRFLRLSLGMEEPTPSEEAYWNNPVPLKERTK